MRRPLLRSPCVVLALALIAGTAGANELRLSLSIGHNLGKPGEPPLQYAQSDAKRFSELFVELGGVAAPDAYVSLGEDASRVRERLYLLAGRIVELKRVGVRTVLLVYVSAHAKGAVLHLGGTELPVAELRALAQTTGAEVRLVVIDACESGVAARPKGTSAGPAYSVSLGGEHIEGEAVLSASGPAQPAQEWDSLGGSLFSHHLLAALRGDADADHDGQVSLSEAYSYAYRRTVLDAVGGGQHPNAEVALRGRGDLVVTSPLSSKTAVVLPEPLEGRYLVASQPRPDVVIEVEKVRGRALRLAVPPGRYLVKKSLGSAVGLLSLELPYGGEAAVDDARLTRRDWREVALKGGYVELHPSALLLFGGVGAPIAAGAARAEAGVGFLHRPGETWLMGAVSGSASRLRGQGLWILENSAAFTAAAGLRWLDLPVTPSVGLALQAEWVRQSFERDQEAEIRDVLGMPPLPEAQALRLSAGPVVGIEVPVSARWFLHGQLRGFVRYAPSAGGPSLSFLPQGELGIGVRL